MTPSQLRAFHLVATAGGYTGAAREAGASQANLSGQVLALERAYDVRLFDRLGRGVRLTDTGQQLFALTGRLFALEDEARALLAGKSAPTRGHLRIAADSAHHVVPLMSAIRAAHPDVTFALAIDNSDAVLDRLARYDADVAVTARGVSDPKLSTIRIRSDRIVLFAPRGHRLAGRRRVSLRAIDGVDLVLRERGSITREVLERAMAAAGVQPARITEVETREGVREVVAAGFGIGAVFESEFTDEGALVRLPVVEPGLEVAEYAVCLRQRRRLPLVRAFMEAAERQG